MVNAPLLFTSYLRPMVWGGRRLGDRLGKPLPAEGLFGEAWELSDHPSHASVVQRHSFQGKTLRQLMEQYAGPLLGPAAPRHQRFPLLVKLLDAWDWLSVQVHPDDEKVKHLWPGEGGKTEAWFILEATPESKIYAGLLPGVDESQLRAALAQGTVAECLHSFTPQPGDCLFLQAGTVHAVGGGVLMAEVQQTSDATFRLFDWNRKDAQGNARTLHIEEALAAIDWTRGPVHPVKTPFAQPWTGPMRHQVLVRCPYFTMEYIEGGECFSWGGTGEMQILMVLDGRGTLEGPAGPEELHRGQTWLLPAALPSLQIHPEGALKLLLSRLPH